VPTPALGTSFQQMPSRKAADALVIFGITGDLARKMTIRSLYRMEKMGRLDVPIVGVARNHWSEKDLIRHFRQALRDNDVKIEKAVFDRLAKRLQYVRATYDDPACYTHVLQALTHLRARKPVFYLEIPPSLFATVVRGLYEVGLTKRARFVIEKPFGHDLASARSLNHELRQMLKEEQILRIDHFLGKEPVMDITYLRFANSMLEPVWNRQYVQYITLTMAEDFGVEDRGRFYDPVGTLRDVVQNHLLQVLALVTMEPPAGHGFDPIREAKLNLFKAMDDANPRRSVRGQYEGYQKVKDVKRGSKTETYIALELAIDNWRWSGVPIFLRAGKALAAKATEIRIVFKPRPKLGPGAGIPSGEPNSMAIRIDPAPGARIRFLSKAPAADEPEPSDFEVLFEKQAGQDPEPYERLLHDALRGNSSLFTREEAIEETWRIVQPLLDKPGPVHKYKRGSWGPPEADKLTRGICHWETPWMPDS
jgi:glucose-6-phosphate 1-dehydrogenase